MISIIYCFRNREKSRTNCLQFYCFWRKCTQQIIPEEKFRGRGEGYSFNYIFENYHMLLKGNISFNYCQMICEPLSKGLTFHPVKINCSTFYPRRVREIGNVHQLKYKAKTATNLPPPLISKEHILLKYTLSFTEKNYFSLPTAIIFFLIQFFFT